MKTVMQSLKEFEKVFCRHEEPDECKFPEREIRELRIKLLKEEYEEYLAAETNNDMVEVADAMADMIYIIAGTAVRYGVKLDLIFGEVHRSNMEKIWSDGKVHHRDDGKVLKPPSWQPPNIARILWNREDE